MVLFGYGKILDVNLSTGHFIKKDIDPHFAYQYIGGMGFSCKILYDEVGVEVNPLSPDNIVIFANGPLTGTHIPCSGRTEITTKSPQTGNIATGNTGGIWGARLKHAGIDLLIIRGQATKPVYLWINDEQVEIRDASHLWGKETQVTTDILCKELNKSPPSKVSVLAIGPAGENLVKYSCPVNDYHHVAARSGAGAVMGVKKLKCIAVQGTGTVNIARPQEFKNVTKEARERLLEAYRAQSIPGASKDARETLLVKGSLPAKNFQTGILPRWLETRTEAIAREYVTGKESTCYACPISCFNLAEVKEGKYTGVRVTRATMNGVVLNWGAQCAIDNLPAIWKCKELCQQLGMDYESAGCCIAFALELYQRGILSRSDTDGLELTWGNEDAIIMMVKKIAYREGFGSILAEGSLRAAELIGNEAKKYAFTIKGIELAQVPDPRVGAKGWIFGSLVNPRGADNVKNTHFHAERYNPNWWIDKFDMFEDVKEKIYHNIPYEEISDTWQGKALMCKWFEDLYSMINALGFCFFPVGFQLAWGPTYISKLYSACTGRDITHEDIIYIGERIFTVLKCYNIRQGLTRKDDIWPDRFFEEPLPEGPSKGAVLSREIIDQVLDEYYELRGWDKNTGLPNAEKLDKLELHDISTELQKLGKIP